MTRRQTPTAAVCTAAILLVMTSACSSTPSNSPSEVARPAEPAPAAPRHVFVKDAVNRMPSMARSGQRVAVVWTGTKDDVMSVYTALSDDGGRTFSAPKLLSDSKTRVSANAEQPPRIAISGDVVSVIWPVRQEGGSAIQMARSTDGGRTFAAAGFLHTDGLTGMRGWQSITPGRDGVAYAVWLDGRHAVPSAGGHHHHGPAPASAAEAPRAAPRQDVYSAVIAADGSAIEAHVAQNVCFCCKTAVGVASGGRVFVAWRHIFPESMRDIALAVSDDGGRTFGSLARVSNDEWKLSGCPDDGPALAVDSGSTAHLVWPTLVNGDAPQKAIFYSATNDGKSFVARIRLSGEATEDAAHPQIAVDRAGNVAAAWDEQAGDRRNVIVRVAKTGGLFGPARVLEDTESGFHPFVVGLERGFLAAWTGGSGAQSSIRVQHIDP